MTTAYELILEKARLQLLPHNRVHAGLNGPHQDEETIVRNSAHWAITFFRCYSWVKEEKFKKAGLNLINLILEDHQSSGNVTFHLRNKKNKDKCNGLIGQAWVIEALVQAAQATGNDKYYEEAEALFLLHPYDQSAHLWNMVEIDGTNQGFDPTFNHQLWFAASACQLISRNKKIKALIYAFLENLKWNLTILPNGLIFHLIDRNLNLPIEKNASFKSVLKQLGIRPAHLLKRIKKDASFTKLMEMSIGYQCFNIYAFTHLKKHLPLGAPSLPNLTKSIDLLSNKFYQKKLEQNIYSFPYNAPGFEVPYIEEQLRKSLFQSPYYFNTQLKKTLNFESQKFEVNTEDSATLDARIYELSQCDSETLKKLKL